MNLEFESLEESLNENLTKNLEKENGGLELEISLNDAGMAVKDALEKGNVIKITTTPKEVENKVVVTSEVQTKSILDNTTMKDMGLDSKKGASKLQTFIEKAEKLGLVGKLLASAGRIGETLVDSIAKKYLKDKFKVNYSTYNDGKKALKAAIKKDGETFLKKGFDVVFSSFKKLPATTKMVLRNVKNKVVDEVISLGKFLIAK